MKTSAILVVAVVSALFFSSCSKRVILSDGEHTKKIWVGGKIEFKKGDLNNQILSFESVNGTKYTIDASKYSYVIK